MECRINAEDPFRGFLPSTGRLVKFQPPEEIPLKVRVDTGVYEGGEISMYYDSMIAKLIVHGKDRTEAIQQMRDALNAFYIRGVSSSIPFQAALMQHPRFCSGSFNTGFIAEEYPKGFHAEDVPHEDFGFLAAVAACARRKYIDRAVRISHQARGMARKVGAEWTVLIGNQYYPLSLMPIDSPHVTGYQVQMADKSYRIISDWHFGLPIFTGTCNGEPICVQIERIGLMFRVAHNGVICKATVMTARAAELLALMPEKVPPDMSKFLLSPMPGLLRELAVAAGQEVKAGEKLAVIEAMKMENVLRAEQDCVVDALLANQGESLSVDQPIIRFK